MQNPLIPIDSKSYITLNGKEINEQLLLVPADVLINGFCAQSRTVLTKNFSDKIQLYYFTEPDSVWHETTLADLPDCQAVFIPKQSFLNKRHFSYHDVVDLIDFLRSPQGCPWDRAQNSLGIRTNIIEEAYELVDAIDLASVAKMTEEVGDVLLQAVFVAQMEAEKGNFTAGDVYDGLCTKLITRHSHIFGGDHAQSDSDALGVWEANKQKEKRFTTHTENLIDVPQGMSSLLRAQKVGKRASKAGMDWQDVAGVIDKCHEEINELKQAISQKDKVEIEKEIGDLLFSLVNLCRFLDVTAEVALNGAINKFIRRFERVEQSLIAKGETFSDCSAEKLDQLWMEAKKSD